MTAMKVIDYLSKVEKGQVVDDEMLYFINAIITINDDQQFELEALRAIVGNNQNDKVSN